MAKAGVLAAAFLLAIGCATEDVQLGPSPPPTASASATSTESQVEVPKVSGRSLSHAKDTLKALGLGWKVTRKESNSKNPGTVLSQSPKAGKMVDPGSKVALTVAKAPRAEPEPEPTCHPAYTGACLDPNASDYDCAGGSGNGPLYTGRVTLVNIYDDPFGLDADNDGVGCE